MCRHGVFSNKNRITVHKLFCNLLFPLMDIISLYKLSSFATPVGLNQCDFVWGMSGSIGDPVCCHTGSYWRLGERDQRCCGISHNAQGSSHNAQGSPPLLLREKNYSLNNVNSATVEKPCPVPQGLPLCRYKVSENHFS